MDREKEKQAKADYKDTLNLPQTDFPMKANLPLKEPEMLAGWQAAGIYEKMQEEAAHKKPSYILHDGPPYANGHIHMGHALNKVLKDIIIKYKTMKGFSSPFVPGWDCHGLPIELQVDKSLGEKKDKTGIIEKRGLCRQYAARFVEIQKEEFRRLGVFGRWEDPYITMTNEYEASIVREFNNFVKGGYVYRGKKPVHWCPSCVTALAEAEVEYYEKESPSIYVGFKLLQEDAARLGLEGENVYLVIWTTTPWTLPANLALAVNPEVEYTAVKAEADGNVYITASVLFDGLKDALRISGPKVRSIEGGQLVGLRAAHPFVDRTSVIIAGGFVTVGEGTGIVHIAPGHGEDDYDAGIKNNLDIYAPVDDRGRFVSTGIPQIDGEFVFKANAAILEILKAQKALLFEQRLTHSYPHCWRCKKPVIFRATEQWFISVKHASLRERCLESIEKINWIPRWGRERIRGMLERRPDWCISRQRAWGVPITLLRCSGCGATVTETQVLDRIEALVLEHGSDVWFERPAEAFVPEGFKCPACGAEGFRKETDILDVWFDSGVSHASVLAVDRELSWPADLYLEGSDQHRGWFQSSLIAAVGTKGDAPYRAVLTHGFVVDGKGRKMSKSLGNVVAPEDIIRKSGAEILRLWVSAEDYRDDIRLSGEIVERLTEAYRKIRNTARFLLGNTSDFEGEASGYPLMEIDRWALSRLQGLIRDVDRAYERFDFHEVYHRLYNFCVVDMSSFYLDILKDRLYTFAKDSPERRAAQFVLRRILVAMTKLMAPILSYMADEIWGYTEGEKEESVFLSRFPEADEGFLDPALEERWKALIAVRDEVNKALEAKRKERLIGNPLDAKVIVYAPEKEHGLISGYLEFLPSLFIVSQAAVEVAEKAPEDDSVFSSVEMPGLKVGVSRAEGQKCQRCWNWSPSVGSHPDDPHICERCIKNLS